jgi:hypothetical protein
MPSTAWQADYRLSKSEINGFNGLKGVCVT